MKGLTGCTLWVTAWFFVIALIVGGLVNACGHGG